MTVGYNLFAYRRDEDHAADRRDGIPDWNLEKAVRWAADRGNDTILIERSPYPIQATAGVTHHVCDDPACPGGC